MFQSILRAELPDGWLGKDSMSLLEPNGRCNVICSSEPLDPSIDAFEYARWQGELLEEEFNGYELIAFKPELVFGGRPGYMREFSWTPEDGRTIRQIQLYYSVSGRGFTATATSPEDDFDDLEATLRHCLLNLKIT